jgi:hypothetical protein
MRKPVFPNIAVLFAAGPALDAGAVDARKAARGFPARSRIPRPGPAGSEAAPKAPRPNKLARGRLPGMRALLRAIEEAERKR